MHSKKIILIAVCNFFSAVATAQSWQQLKDSMMAAYNKSNYTAIIKFAAPIQQEFFTPAKKNKKFQASICFMLGTAYSETDQVVPAEKLLLLARKLFDKKAKNKENFAVTCNSLGNLYLRWGKFDKAEYFSKESLNQLQSLFKGYDNKLFTPYITLGNIYSATRQFEKADSVFLKLKELLPPEEITQLFKVNRFIALNLIKMEQYDKAESVITAMITDAEKNSGSENIIYADAFTLAGRFYYDLRDFQKAELWIIKALRLYEKKQQMEHPNYMANSSNLAYAYLFSGRIKEADSLFSLNLKAIENKSSPQSDEYAYASTGKALILMETGQYEKAIALLVENLDNLEKLKLTNRAIYMGMTNNLAFVYQRAGQLEKAESLFLKSLKITESLFNKEHAQFRMICGNLAFLYWKMNRPNEAMQYSLLTLSIIKKQIDKVFSFSSENEKLSFMRTLAVERNKFYSLIYKLSPNENSNDLYDLTIYAKGLLLNSSKQLNADILNGSDTSAKKIYSSWLSNKNQLAYWYSKPLAEQVTNLDSLKEITEQQEKQLVRVSSAFNANKISVSANWENVQKKLKPGEAAIEFIVFNYFDKERLTDSVFYAALILRPNSAKPEFVFLFEEKQIDSLLTKNPDNNQNKINKLYNASGAKPRDNRLYQLTWSAIEKKLVDVRTIYFSPVGELFKLSFAAIPINETTRLSDKYHLVQLNSTRALLETTDEKILPADRLILYGGIAYDADSVKLKQLAGQYNEPANEPRTKFQPEEKQSWNYLPFSKAEVEKIQKTGIENKYPVSVISEENATEESLKALSGNRSPAVLHIATHGFFFPDPKPGLETQNGQQQFFKISDNPLLRSGLLFAGSYYTWTKNRSVSGIEDGIATAYEITNMYLPHTKLVVLSACETGLGELNGSDGVLGLQRAFRIAGVKNLVMSLWKVPDTETAEFMIAFYENLFRQQTIPDAFVAAQKTMKNKYRNDPYKWAAFILVR